MTEPAPDADPVRALWMACTGALGTDDIWHDLADSEQVASLRSFPYDVLRGAAFRSRRHDGNDAYERLPLDEWLDACGPLSSVPATVERLGGAERARRTLQRRLDPDIVQRVETAFGPEVSAAAIALLRERVRTGRQDDLILHPLRHKWRVAPSGSVVGAPVVDAPEAELAVVSLLATTTGPWQFSCTPRGWIFPTSRYGSALHEIDQRDYVAGLSTILDTAAGVIERHRNGDGGRVFITRQYMECADCNRVVAWLNDRGTRPEVLAASTPHGRNKSRR